MRQLKLALLAVCSALVWPALADESVSLLSRGDITSGTSALPTAGYLVSGQPDAEVLDTLQEAGFSTVVDLRTAGEDRGIDEAAEVEARGMSYVPLPVAGSAGISFENARRLDELLAGIEGPVFLHCGSGNRAGALLALRASLHGASDPEALALGKAAGLTRLEPVVRERLAERVPGEGTD